MPNTRSATKRAAQSSEFMDFKKALMNLGNADTPVVAELSAMFKQLSKQPGFDELQKKLSEDGQKLAKMIFEIPEEFTPRPLPKLLFGHPPEIANMIFKDVDPIDLLNLAAVSKSSRNLVESLCIKVDKIDVCYSDRATITISTATDKSFDFEIRTSRELVEESRRNGTIRSFGNCEFAFDSSGNVYVDGSIIYCSDIEQFAMMLVRFLFGIYRTEDVSFVFTCAKKEFMMYFIKNITTRFSDFYIISDVKLTDEEFRVVMEDISVSGEFKSMSNFKNNYDGPLQHKNMVLVMPWKPINLIGMRCEQLSLYKRKFSVKDLKTFARNWKEGGAMPQLKSVTFEYDRRVVRGEETKNLVCTSLESLGFTNQLPQLPPHPKLEQDGLENWLHMKREDGRVASLQFLLGTFGEYRYYFLFWH